MSKWNLGCSTICLEGGLVVGHNADIGRRLDGAVVVNPRGVKKTSASFAQLLSGSPETGPRLDWTSRMGSLTFNVFGKEFIDGGLNEAGLYIQEMTLIGTRFPSPAGRPVLFMALWMQYVLDQFSTVDEVLGDLPRIALDGWDWHFFVCDGSGNRASLEFLDGDTVVHAGESMPAPVMCNATYASELAALRRYSGFGGSDPVDLGLKLPVVVEGKATGDEDNRFVHAAHLLQRSADDPVLQALDILAAMDRGVTQWTYVMDARSSDVIIKTSLAPELKSFNLSSIDFSEGAGPQFLDMNLRAAGDVSQSFRPLEGAANVTLVRNGLAMLNEEGVVSDWCAAYGRKVDDVIESFTQYGLSPAHPNLLPAP